MADKEKQKTTVQRSSKATASASKAKEMVMVEALKTPVTCANAKLAKGGRVAMDKATAELKAKAGEVTIVGVVD